MPEREPPHVLRDLKKKVMADFAGSLRRTVDLVDHPEDRWEIVRATFSGLLGITIAEYLLVMGEPLPKSLTVDAAEELGNRVLRAVQEVDRRNYILKQEARSRGQERNDR